MRADRFVGDFLVTAPAPGQSIARPQLSSAEKDHSEAVVLWGERTLDILMTGQEDGLALEQFAGKKACLGYGIEIRHGLVQQ